MYHWVTDKEFLKKAYSECADIVNRLVQRMNAHGFKASMQVVGSKSRNMITQNADDPIDFDFNILIGSQDLIDDAERLKEDSRALFNEVLREMSLQDCEDSKVPLTTKKIRFRTGNSTAFSIDVCLVSFDQTGKLCRLVHEKTGRNKTDRWIWNQVPDSDDLWHKEDFLKPAYWQQVRDVYLKKKNMYLQMPFDNSHPSFVCYIEAVNEVYEDVRRHNG